MTILGTFIKQPADRLDYDFDYSLFLIDVDTLETAVFEVVTLVESETEITTPNPLAIDAEVVADTYTKVWVSGGEIGYIYKISCTVTTGHGRVKQDELKIKIKEY